MRYTSRLYVAASLMVILSDLVTIGRMGTTLPSSAINLQAKTNDVPACLVGPEGSMQKQLQHCHIYVHANKCHSTCHHPDSPLCVSSLCKYSALVALPARPMHAGTFLVRHAHTCWQFCSKALLGLVCSSTACRGRLKAQNRSRQMH